LLQLIGQIPWLCFADSCFTPFRREPAFGQTVARCSSKTAPDCPVLDILGIGGRSQSEASRGLDRIPYIDNSRYMESENVIAALAALAQSTRLDVFRRLVRHEPAGIAAGELARLLQVPQNTMSSHLAILSRAGLVTAQRQSRFIIYRADLKAFQAVALFLLQDCCGGKPEICAPLIESLTPCCSPEKKTRAKEKAHA
jgi:ArsR family transcriptional regulator, arsenate/arsenite/antimonite-responsive transcriptional repressor